MRSLSTRDYGHCPNCGAPNLRHRRDCYVCHTPLGTGERPSQPPDSVDGLSAMLDNHRRVARIDVPTYSLILEGDNIPRHEARFRNIGANGVGVLTTVPCPIGENVQVEVVIQGRTYRAGGIVRHCSASGDAPRTVYLVGIHLVYSLPPLSLLLPPRTAA